MKQLSDTEYKSIILQVLEELDRYCTLNGINYSLAYGTLLGAVRHQGFIPWDDDIDIMMPRYDYNKFITQYNQNSVNFRYRIRASENESNFPYPFAKFEDTCTYAEDLGITNIGVSIDIFPYDSIPVSINEINRIVKKSRLILNCYAIKNLQWRKGRNVMKNLFLLVAKMFLITISYDFLHKCILNLVAKKNCATTTVGCIFGVYGKKEIMPENIFQDYINLTFEGKEFRCIKSYNKFLESIYGDYMELPPIKERVSHHSVIAFIK